MKVVADTSTLNYLILIGEADLLFSLYGRVLIPEAVRSELGHRRAPSKVVEWIESHPQWLEVQPVHVRSEDSGEYLDLGETEAIGLAELYKPDVLLLMDEETGRLEATRRAIRTTGTLGLLDDAAARGLVDLESAIRRLRKTNFRASESLFEWLLARNRQRNKLQ